MNFSALAATALAFLLLAGHDAVAVTCAGPEKSDGICGDQELMTLRQAGEVKLKRLLVPADPLGAMLMRRDQRWFMEIVHGLGDGAPFDTKDDSAAYPGKAYDRIR